jgi:hypothetical protein
MDSKTLSDFVETQTEYKSFDWELCIDVAITFVKWYEGLNSNRKCMFSHKQLIAYLTPVLGEPVWEKTFDMKIWKGLRLKNNWVEANPTYWN